MITLLQMHGTNLVVSLEIKFPRYADLQVIAYGLMDRIL